MRFINLCPHALTLRPQVGADLVVPPSGSVARVKTIPATPGFLVTRDFGTFEVAPPTTYGAVEGLPEPVDGVIYLVSGQVREQVARKDVFSPGTGPEDGAIREKGQVVAVTRLIASV